MKILEIRPDQSGRVEYDGVEREVMLDLVSSAVVGDYVIIHAGCAIERLDLAEAEERLRLFAEWSAMNDADARTASGPGNAP